MPRAPAADTTPNDLKHLFHRDLQRSLDVLAGASCQSPRDRAVFYSSDARRVGSPWSDEPVSLNCYLAERFLSEQNAKLGYDVLQRGHVVAEGELYVTMHQLPEGRALHAVTALSPDQPRIVHFHGRAFRNDSYAATAALVDAVAGAFSQQANGIVTVAVDSSEPDTFFRRIEHPHLMQNNAVPFVRTLALDRSAADWSPGGLTGARIVQRIFPKELWNQWQRDQWLAASISALGAHLGAGAPDRTDAVIAAKIRFLGELRSICREVDGLQTVPGEASRRAELRLQRAARFAARRPDLLELAGRSAEQFHTAVEKDLYRQDGLGEQRLREDFFGSPLDAPLFAASELASLREHVDRALKGAQRIAE